MAEPDKHPSQMTMEEFRAYFEGVDDPAEGADIARQLKERLEENPEEVESPADKLHFLSDHFRVGIDVTADLHHLNSAGLAEAADSLRDSLRDRSRRRRPGTPRPDAGAAAGDRPWYHDSRILTGSIIGAILLALLGAFVIHSVTREAEASQQVPREQQNATIGDVERIAEETVSSGFSRFGKQARGEQVPAATGPVDEAADAAAGAVVSRLSSLEGRVNDVQSQVKSFLGPDNELTPEDIQKMDAWLKEQLAPVAEALEKHGNRLDQIEGLLGPPEKAQELMDALEKREELAAEIDEARQERRKAQRRISVYKDEVDQATAKLEGTTDPVTREDIQLRVESERRLLTNARDSLNSAEQRLMSAKDELSSLNSRIDQLQTELENTVLGKLREHALAIEELKERTRQTVADDPSIMPSEGAQPPVQNGQPQGALQGNGQPQEVPEKLAVVKKRITATKKLIMELESNLEDQQASNAQAWLKKRIAKKRAYLKKLQAKRQELEPQEQQEASQQQDAPDYGWTKGRPAGVKKIEVIGANGDSRSYEGETWIDRDAGWVYFLTEEGMKKANLNTSRYSVRIID